MLKHLRPRRPRRIIATRPSRTQVALPNALPQGPFQRCRDCRAWVDSRAEQCPICGIAWPTSRWLTLRQEIGLAWRDLAAAIGGLGGVAAGLMIWLFWRHAIRYGMAGPLRLVFVLFCSATAYVLGRALASQRTAFFLGCIALGLSMPVAMHGEWLFEYPDGLMGTVLTVLLAGFGWTAGRFLGPAIAAQNWELRQPRNVMETLAGIEQRVVELRGSREKMRMLSLRLAQQLPGGTQHPALNTLRTAVQATEAQYHSHVIHAWQLTTAIWQNQAQPVLANWREMDATGCEQAVATLDKMTHEAERLLTQWRQEPEAEDPRGQRAMAQLERLTAAVAHLRQAVLLQQAKALAQATPGIAEAFAAATLPGAALNQIDELRQGARFLDMSGTAADLIAENERLRAEQAAIQEVEKLVGG